MRLRSGNPNPYQAWDKRIKNRASVPRRERWLVQNVLAKLNIRYKIQVRIWNPMFTGLRKRTDGGWQWLDFVLRAPFGLAVLIFRPSYGQSYPHDFEKRALAEKQDFLEKRDTPYLVLSREMSQQEYEVAIDFWLRKETRKRSNPSAS